MLAGRNVCAIIFLTFIGLCDGFGKFKPTGCADFEIGLKAQFGDQTLTCAQAKNDGACSPTSKYFFTARSFCAQTCGVCPKVTTAPTPQPALTAAPTLPDLTGTMVNGTWCSPLCCCQAPWRGFHCQDFNECASSPCQNGGKCEDSSATHLVNDYYRKFRCTCARGYGGHACDGKLRPVSSSCHLSSGISSTKGGTSSIESYYIFQAALEYMDTTIRSSDTNFNRLCRSVFTRMEMGGICQQKFELFNMQGKKISDVAIDCKKEPELYVGLRLCSTPCMRLGSRIWGQKMVSEGSRLAESERGVWF